MKILPLPSGEFLTLYNRPLHNNFVEMLADFTSVKVFVSHSVRISSLITITVLFGGAILGTLTVPQPVNAQSKAGCSDGIDNDNDGAIDSTDIECTDRDILDAYEAAAEFYFTCQEDRADGDRNFDGDIWDTKKTLYAVTSSKPAID